MELPPELIVQHINEICILHFKDSAHDEDAPAHYYLTIPVNNNADFVLSIITSQAEKRREYYLRANLPSAIQSLVQVSHSDLSFLNPNKASLIECNQAILLSKNQLIRRISREHNFSVICRSGNISASLVKKVREAVMASPLVKENIKKLLAD